MSEAGQLFQGRFEGREAFQNLVRQAFATAAREGWRDITVCDATFEDWPLREREVAESLNAWAKAGRHFTMLATRYDAVLRLHARFVNWRLKRSHLIDCRQCKGADPLDFPSALLGPDWVMQRLDVPRCNGMAGAEPVRWAALREVLRERTRASSSGFAASTLGL